MGPATRLPEVVLAWARTAVGPGSRVVSVRLLGVHSTVLHRLDVGDRHGTLHRLVVRRFHDRARLTSDRWYAPDNEARALAALEHSRVPRPRLIAADTRGDVCDVPTLLTTWLPGRPPTRRGKMESFLTQMALVLVDIHRLDPSGLLTYTPYHNSAADGERKAPAWSQQPYLWQRVFEILERPAPQTPVGLIHRDYHHGQTLWRGDQLTGVVDWTTACFGPRGIDLARMQINLTEFGVAVADRFVAIHQTVSGEQVRHPYWDLLDAGDLLLDLPGPDRPAEAPGYRAFEHWVARALSELA